MAFSPLRRVPTRAAAAAVAALGVVGLAEGLAASPAEHATAAAPSARGTDDRPNIVVVMTDDQDARSLREMPIVSRQIAGKGVSFRNSAASFPTCCPSRATFLTGQYSHNNGVAGHPEGDANCIDELDESTTLPVALEDSGYRTGLIGKYMNGYARHARDLGLQESIPPGWSDFEGVIDAGYFNWALNDNGKRRAYGDAEDEYQTDIIARHAVSYLRQQTGPDRGPAFLYVSTAAPHGENGIRGEDRNPRPAPRHRGIYDDARLPTPPSFNEADVSDKPRFLRAPRLSKLDRKTLTGRFRGRSESLLAVDEMVARMQAELRRRKELKNTLFVYTSDNGFLLGEHRLLKKKVLYEESAQVPLVISGPGFRGGERADVPASNIDLAPTILEAAGVDPLLEPDGVALQEAVARPKGFAGRDVLYENDRVGSDRSHGVRDKRYVYIEHEIGNRIERELYDLERDPYQLTNRADDPELASVQARLAGRLGVLRSCAGPTCR